MSIPLNLETFSWPPYEIKLYVPDQQALKQQWQQPEMANDFPYWARVWPSALALCDFLTRHPNLIQNKNVVEIAAGLALPSLLAAHFAQQVSCSDAAPDAAQVVHQSILINHLRNIDCKTLNWNRLDINEAGDVLLLSDVNYEEAVFEELLILLKNCIANGTTIILSTPQRLMAKPFIERLMRFCILQEEVKVDYKGEIVYASVFVLRSL